MTQNEFKTRIWEESPVVTEEKYLNERVRLLKGASKPKATETTNILIIPML